MKNQTEKMVRWWEWVDWLLTFKNCRTHKELQTAKIWVEVCKYRRLRFP